MENLITINTKDALNKLLVTLEQADFIAYDTETTGLTKNDTIIGMCLCSQLTEAYYVVLQYWDKEQQKLIKSNVYDFAKDILSVLANKRLIMHNAVFDCFITEANYSINLMPALHTDTMILGHLLDENRSNGLKELGVSLFGEDAKAEQIAMKASVEANDGVLTKDKYEMYKADTHLMANYGAKDALLTLKIFYQLIPDLYEQGLNSFFYEEESMPLLKGPTYQLNTSGLLVDPNRLLTLKLQLEADCLEALSFINKEIEPLIKEKLSTTKKPKPFNVNSSKQLAWLLFIVSDNVFNKLTESGKELCKAFNMRLPYNNSDKRSFIRFCIDNYEQTYHDSKSKLKKVRKPENYIACGKETLIPLADKYKWVKRFLEYTKDRKLLSTYVEGIQSRTSYNIIRPSFLQHGTTSGRYSSKNPNFQNLPRDDKRVKSVIVSRPGSVFVGADYSQLEPRVFASLSGDETLMASFAKGEDFYSVVGAPIFDKFGLSLIKDDLNSFAKQFPKLRDKAKVIALATPYGRTASFTAEQMKVSKEEAQDIMDKYFEAYPKVQQLMLDSHKEVKTKGIVYSAFGRPRRILEALEFNEIYGNTEHKDLPYTARNLLNLAMNHRIQSTGASIINRASISFYKKINELGLINCKIVMQVHDELIIECLESDKEIVSFWLKECMENTVKLQGVNLIVEPKIGTDLSQLK